MPKTREELEQETQNQPVLETPVIPTEDSQTPPSNPPTSVITQEQLTATHNLYGEALREQTRLADDLRKQLEDARRNNAPVVDDSQLTPEQLIKKQVDLSVKPLLDEFTQFRVVQQANVYQNLKNQFRSLPQLANIFPTIEPYIDQEMQGKEVNVQSVHAAIAKVIGLIQMQQMTQPQVPPVVPQNQPNNLPVNQNRNDQMLPPHLRPSNPPAPDRNGAPVRRQLTELEKRVAREQGKSEEDYLAWIDVSPTDVVRSTIGVPK